MSSAYKNTATLSPSKCTSEEEECHPVPRVAEFKSKLNGAAGIERCERKDIGAH